jgi:hypothetical protein
LHQLLALVVLSLAAILALRGMRRLQWLAPLYETESLDVASRI